MKLSAAPAGSVALQNKEACVQGTQGTSSEQEIDVSFAMGGRAYGYRGRRNNAGRQDLLHTFPRSKRLFHRLRRNREELQTVVSVQLRGASPTSPQQGQTMPGRPPPEQPRRVRGEAPRTFNGTTETRCDGVGKRIGGTGTGAYRRVQPGGQWRDTSAKDCGASSRSRRAAALTPLRTKKRT